MANKIFHNVGKTELVLLASPKKQLPNDLKIKLKRKKLYLYETDSVTLLRMQVEKSLTK